MQDHKITLFHANWSFCSQMVRFALFELNIKFEERHIILCDQYAEGENLDKNFLDINPLATVPVIKINNEVIVNSTTIIEELNKRKSWHGDCAVEYMIIYHSREARRHVWLRDRGKCNGCGKKCTRRGWDLDHIKPLMEQKGRAEKELVWSYYWLDNMQTLCKPCHNEKTKQDRKNNA